MSSFESVGNYGPQCSRLLKQANVQPGDKIKVETDLLVYSGYLLPRFDVGDPNALILKLKSGYNVGIACDKITNILPLNEHIDLAKFPETSVPKQPNLPVISLYSSGGTISSKIDYLTGGVSMTMSPQEIFNGIPELAELVSFSEVKQLFQLGSEELWVNQWKVMAEAAVSRLNSEDEGFVLLHGTDTMAYTAAALSFFIRDLNKPVILTGAQRSSDRGSFDGAVNILCSAIGATKLPMAEVGIVMHDSPSDETCAFIRGTRARKMHTSRRDAFRSINEHPLARIHRSGSISILNPRYQPRSDREPYADLSFEEKIALLKAYPGSNPEILDWYVDKGYKGIIIEGTGLGHTPTIPPPEESHRSWLPAIQRATEEGVLIGMTSQCIYGRVHPFVYKALRLLSKANVLYLEDMLPETAYVKLGYVLGKQLSSEESRKLMTTPLAGEISPSSDGTVFLI